VAHVEQTGTVAHGSMLHAKASVLDRHFIPGEGNHFGSGFNVHIVQRGSQQGIDRFHAAKVAGAGRRGAPFVPDLSPPLSLYAEIAQVQRDVILADRATTAIERIIRQLQGASLIGAERAKDEIVNRIRGLAANAMPADARKARFDSIADDIWSVLAHNHRIYYLVEAQRVVVLDVILDAEIHSVESD